jgi:hypothetical protein
LNVTFCDAGVGPIDDRDVVVEPDVRVADVVVLGVAAAVVEDEDVFGVGGAGCRRSMVWITGGPACNMTEFI